MIYLVVLFLLLLLSVRYDIYGKTRANEFWYGFMLVVFILVAGLRWRIGIDTPQYLYKFYHEYPTIDKFSFEEFPIGKDPLFVLLNSIIKTIGGRFYIVQLTHAAIVNILIFNYIKKHSKYIFTCLFFYAITCYTTYNMEIMRGSLSIVLCLYANDYILEKKWLKGYSLYFLALMFHVQTILLFILPILFFLKFNKVGVVFLFGAYLLGIIIMDVLGDYLFLFEDNESISRKVSIYSRSEKYGAQNGNLNLYFIQILPLLIYVLVSFIYIKIKYTNSSLLKFEPFIFLGVMFILIRMNLEIAYRYVDYFKIYFVLFFSEFFIKLIDGARVISKEVAVFRSYVIFIPFFLVFMVYNYILSKEYSLRYTPYSSVIERIVSMKRENMYIDLNASKDFYPSANKYEY